MQAQPVSEARTSFTVIRSLTRVLPPFHVISTGTSDSECSGEISSAKQNQINETARGCSTALEMTIGVSYTSCKAIIRVKRKRTPKAYTRQKQASPAELSKFLFFLQNPSNTAYMIGIV